MPNKRTRRKAQLDFVIFMVFVVLALVALLLGSSKAKVSTVRTMVLTDDVSGMNTHLMIMLNNNQCGYPSTMPLKDIIAVGLAQDVSHIESGNTDFSIDYNGQVVDDIDIKACIETYFTTLGIDDYYFFTTYDGSNMTKVNTFNPYDLDDNEKVIVELEYISVPDDDRNIATAVLFLKVRGDRYDVEENSICPDTSSRTCYPTLTCINYGGECDDNYLCPSQECCCRGIAEW